jgi:hypothetical protein
MLRIYSYPDPHGLIINRFRFIFNTFIHCRRDQFSDLCCTNAITLVFKSQVYSVFTVYIYKLQAWFFLSSDMLEVSRSKILEDYRTRLTVFAALYFERFQLQDENKIGKHVIYQRHGCFCRSFRVCSLSSLCNISSEFASTQMTGYFSCLPLGIQK